jgi:hypothetical protein
MGWSQTTLGGGGAAGASASGAGAATPDGSERRAWRCSAVRQQLVAMRYSHARSGARPGHAIAVGEELAPERLGALGELGVGRGHGGESYLGT